MQALEAQGLSPDKVQVLQVKGENDDNTQYVIVECDGTDKLDGNAIAELINQNKARGGAATTEGPVSATTEGPVSTTPVTAAAAAAAAGRLRENPARHVQVADSALTSADTGDVTVTSEQRHDVTVMAEQRQDVTVTAEQRHDVTVTSEQRQDVTVTAEQRHDVTVTSADTEDVNVTSEQGHDVKVMSEQRHDVTVTSETGHDVTVTSEQGYDIIMTSEQDVMSAGSDVTGVSLTLSSSAASARQRGILKRQHSIDLADQSGGAGRKTAGGTAAQPPVKVKVTENSHGERIPQAATVCDSKDQT